MVECFVFLRPLGIRLIWGEFMFAAFDIGVSILTGLFAGNDVVLAANQIQNFDEMNLGPWVVVILFSMLAIAGIFFSKANPPESKEPSNGEPPNNTGEEAGTGDPELDEIVRAAGYSYEEKQDIFYSNMNAWQRNMGYCRLYDEASAPLGMIIDCEPIYFEYGGKRWMIELWKGQYDLTTGCEVGVYTSDHLDINIPGIFRGTFYYCASNDDLLAMSCSLKKNGRTIFSREDKHWWLTGFKLGEFSEPSELTMEISITLKDEPMRNAFINGLRGAGYPRKKFEINGNTVSLIFDEPYTVSRIVAMSFCEPRSW